MLFYKYTYSINGELIEEKNNENKIRPWNKDLNPEGIICMEFCEEMDDVKFYILNKTDEYITFLGVFKGGLNKVNTLDMLAYELVLKLNLNMFIAEKQELSVQHFFQELNKSEENRYIESSRDVKEQLYLNFSRGLWFKERKFYLKNFSKEEMLKNCEKLVVDNELKREIERIYQNSQDNSFGVPVQYIISVSNDEERSKVVEILLNSLKSNNRTIRGFYSVIDLMYKNSAISPSEIEKLFSISAGGAMVINGHFKILEDDVFSEEQMITEQFAEQICKRACEVTSIICCKHKSQEMVFKEYLRDFLLVEINDATIKNIEAKEFLKDYANKLDIEKIDGLLDMVDENIAYNTNDLIKIFSKWRKDYVKNIQYPQYANLSKQEQIVENSKKESAINLLNEMVGLDGVKQTIENYLNYAKLQKACLANGAIVKNTCKHMCFVGNPGTAKTTVARYVAQVMKENGILKNGNIIEVSRGDIVSRYVGGTAPNVQELFKKAMGNVLFIDEAYSLCDGKEGMYGDEAINAIVQEMENRREDVIVIFAGYKNEMEKFLNKNSGLKSRIASIIEFPDYTEEELLSIADIQANKMDIDISQCKEVIKEIITIGKKQDTNFGNGRFVRNILENARMKQASRLVKEDKMYGSNLRIIKPDDFEVPTYKEKRHMGFC